ncbi:Wadjet anti-phage system protein JetD domain-containing protein [Cellulomonas sp. CW35]|uniref:Wadjet anti-phage system protein JetD domain-containing protein n=1 Tax=Cellulomonas sp. CW35 TaxID=3458249 RepID=UPI004033613E
MRARCPEVTSVLMDEATFLAHRDMSVGDPNSEPRSTPTRSERLTADESAVEMLLRELGGVRLEHELLARPACLLALGHA